MISVMKGACHQFFVLFFSHSTMMMAAGGSWKGSELAEMQHGLTGRHSLVTEHRSFCLFEVSLCKHFYSQLMSLRRIKKKKLIILFSKDALSLAYSVSNKCCSFDLSIHQRILKKCITVSTKIKSSTNDFNIDNNIKCFLSSKSAY